MLRSLLCLSFLSFSILVYAGKIAGRVTDDKGIPLPYASISIKGTTRGTNANSSGYYSITLSPGQYTLICQYVNYKKEEKTVTITADDLGVDFSLTVQQLTLSEVIVKKGEDPAYEIIRQAIKKRSYYNGQVDSFSVDVYIKGLLRSRGMPSRIFGQKIERDQSDGLDSLGKGILFLSESVTKVSFKKPDKIKYNVISSRQSGGGFGLSFPFFINFYQNNVSVFDNNLNPRGFISPIADGALNFYKYRYEGSFVEEGKMVNTIKVTPRRKNEPLFSGTIQIIEDDWRIYSLDLQTTKDYSLELVDTIRISQIHSAVTADVWKTKNQVVYVAVKMLGFDFTGNFVNVYSDYDLAPGFTKKFFDRVLMKYDTAANKRDSNYWNTVRPVALEQDEKRDFVFKDSVAKVMRDSFLTRRNIDSLRKNQKPISLKDIVWSGAHHNFYGKKRIVSYSAKPLLTKLDYNTVEGLAVVVEQSLHFNRLKKKLNYTLDWNTRYGFSNTHLNSYADLTIRPKGLYSNIRNRYLKLSGGKRLSQFNHESPLDPFSNAITTLFWKENYMKLYENWFGRVEFNTRTESGIRLNFHITYEDRLPVENSTDFSILAKHKTILPNHPYELASIPFNRHQALVAGMKLTWQPGQRYIEFPRYRMPIGSDAPTFTLEYNKGIENVLGSDVNFDKWRLSVTDNLNFKLGGEFKYKLSIGGFLNNKKAEIPDFQHFNGNQVYSIRKYLDAFQMAPYYRYSNTENFYTVAHIEHHFNGLLTNKIPLFNKLKWYMVAGANAFYVDKNKNYVEAFLGVENIFKIFRVDFINAYQPGLNYQFGVKIGAGGLIGGKIRFDQ
ncbi:MAG: carboxypeptidase-like regulatory domain-containing protein [Chitinophagaceae bacterium]|nr:carboxypeptidase-like regulatory domain-containing protein [Chitinophagaceae bacterium]